MAESEAARRVQALLDQLRPFAAESSELGSSSSEEREGDIQGEEGTAPPEDQPSLQSSSDAFEPNVQNAISFSQRQTELHHSAKHALSELKPSSARLDELRKLADSTGREQLSLADAARLRALEHNEELIHERDRLRNELDAATNRERSAEQELSQLKHSRGFGDSEAAELRGRAERAEETRNKLYTELEDARTKIKELSTQGSMYNDISNRFEKESNRAAALERERDSLNDSLAKQQEECGRLRTELNEYIHRAELLERDKSHLSAELQHCKDEQRKLEGETERVKSELQSAHSAKDDLQERILSKGTEERSNYEAKLESELNSLRQSMQAEAEKRQADARAHEDRELEALRELRDAAREEAEQLRQELKEARTQYEELLAQHRSLQAQSDTSAAEAQGQLRVKAFETERLQAIRAEQQESLQELRAENEKLRKKCNYLESEYHKLESSSSRKAADLESELAQTASRLGEYQEMERDLDVDAKEYGDEAACNHLPTSMRHRLQHARELAQKVSQLQDALSEEQQRRQSAEQQRKRLETEASRLREQGQMAHQPLEYLVEKMQRAESEASRLREEAQDSRAERDSAVSDLQQLIQQRQSLAKVEEHFKKKRFKASANGGARQRRKGQERAARVKAITNS